MRSYSSTQHSYRTFCPQSSREASSLKPTVGGMATVGGMGWGPTVQAGGGGAAVVVIPGGTTTGGVTLGFGVVGIS